MKKFLTLTAIFVLLAHTLLVPAVAFAAPELPEQPSTSTTTDDPEVPDLPDNDPDQNHEETEDPEPTPEPEEEEVALEEPDEPQLPGEEDPVEETTNNQVGGDVEIETGDANGAGTINNIGNTNAATTPAGDSYKSGVGGVSIVNEENGTDSENSGDINILDEKNTNQVNDADLANSLVIDTDTGDNSASGNTKADSTIKTGDATSTGTIFNSVNTNVDGLIISEFNVFDDQVGDYVLDFAANCVSGCGSGGVNVANTGNGSNSENSGDVNILSDSTTFQQNDAVIENELVLTANTGDNTADNNTGGNSDIKTGDATVVGNILNFFNNNFSGNVVYGVVNIFGDLAGDIVIPENYMAGLPAQSVNIGNTGNGSNSENSGDVDTTTIDNYAQFNNAQITNNLLIDTNTGKNQANDNTGGNSKIETGNSDVDVNVVNFANNNIIGGDWWIVLVNDAGNWFGKIIGLPGTTVGNNLAMSQGSASAQNDNYVDIENVGNGTGSENTGTVNLTDINNTTQGNNAVINNNVVLDANTGRNSTSRNTNGNNSVKTGDANAMLNIINFGNNNFANANVFLTVVNVFGDWVGDLLTPGAVKEAQAPEKAIGGADIPATNNNNSSSGSSSSGSSSSASNNSANSPTPTANITGTLLANAAKTGSFIGTGKEVEEPEKLADASVLGETVEKGKIRINLAWGILLLPIYFIGKVGFALLKRV